MEKCIFAKIFGLSKLLTGRENGSQKGITGRELGSQKSLPDGNLALKYHYRTGIGLSNIITGHDIGCQFFLSEKLFLCKLMNILKTYVSPCSLPD